MDNEKAEPQAVDCPEFLSQTRLAARMLIAGDDPREFKKLYDQLCAEWQPRSTAEWFYFERILHVRWTLPRLDLAESRLFAQIGRTVWAKKGDVTLKEVLGPKLHETRASLNAISKLRANAIKSLSRSIRELQREQASRRLDPKPAPAGDSQDRLQDGQARTESGLEPLTRSIQ